MPNHLNALLLFCKQKYNHRVPIRVFLEHKYFEHSDLCPLRGLPAEILAFNGHADVLLYFKSKVTNRPDLWGGHRLITAAIAGGNIRCLSIVAGKEDLEAVPTIFEDKYVPDIINLVFDFMIPNHDNHEMVKIFCNQAQKEIKANIQSMITLCLQYGRPKTLAYVYQLCHLWNLQDDKSQSERCYEILAQMVENKKRVNETPSMENEWPKILKKHVSLLEENEILEYSAKRKRTLDVKLETDLLHCFMVVFYANEHLFKGDALDWEQLQNIFVKSIELELWKAAEIILREGMIPRLNPSLNELTGCMNCIVHDIIVNPKAPQILKQLTLIYFPWNTYDLKLRDIMNTAGFDPNQYSVMRLDALREQEKLEWNCQRVDHLKECLYEDTMKVMKLNTNYVNKLEAQ